MKTLALCATVLLALVATAQKADAQDFEHAPCFAWVIDSAEYTSGSLTVLFRITNPLAGTTLCGANASWQLSDPHITQPGVSSLTIDIGWSARDYSNIGSQGTLASLAQGGGRGAALPIRVNALTGGDKAVLVPGTSDQYRVTKVLPTTASGTGAVGIEGRAAWFDGTGWVRVPVKSSVTYFPIDSVEPRRQVVDIGKCQGCHNGVSRNSEGGTIPRLSMHGNSRNENLELCVICHNPYQTDIPYRTSGAEVSVDFKRMIHAIHASKFRESEPLVIIGFNGSVNDFSHTPFPGEIRNCLYCHIDKDGKGTFEIPATSALATFAAGSTVDSRSTPGCCIDLDPANDLKITPIAAVCSSCHDRDDPKRHMISKGASFSIEQADIRYWVGNIPGTERCPACHGPGKQKDVRRAHEIHSGGGSGSGDR